MSKEKLPTTWNLTHLYASDDDPKMKEDRKKWQEAAQTFASKWQDREDYLEDPATLKEALDEYEAFCSKFADTHHELYYFWLKKNLDMQNPQIKARFSKISEFAEEIDNLMRFFSIRISKIPQEKQKLFLEFEPLAPYHHYLQQSFAVAQYVLSEPEEKIMSLKARSSSELWRSMLGEFLNSEEAEVLDEGGKTSNQSFSHIMSLLSSSDKKVRDTACVAFNDILEKHAHVAQAEINALLHDKKVNDELRGYARPDQARHIGDDISSEIVDTLVETVTANFGIAKEFYALKAQLLDLKKLGYHERNVEYGSIDKDISYEESVKLVQTVFSKLDPEFEKIFSHFVNDGLIDAYPKKGKRDGAFCVHFLKTQPTYILLNHTDKLRDVSTIAHEAGHGINNELIKKKQHALYFGTPLSTAEVASTFMEDFVLDEVAKDADEETRLTLLMQRLNDSISSIMRQVACYTFEQELHTSYREKGFLSNEDIGSLFSKHMKAYMGDAVEHTDESKNWWIYWSHIRSYFYVYSYASGLLISKALQRKVRNDPTYITQVKQFLSAGLSKSPEDIFKEIGIDITKKSFWQEGLQEIKEQLVEAQKLAKKLGKI